MVRFEPAIGLEIHVQLDTRTKLFCGDAAGFGGEPNARVCPICLGLPGALPATNRKAVDLAIRAALGLQCTVHSVSRFARKHYFYPDLPKGYQITQHDEPLATDGWFDVSVDRDGAGAAAVRIRRIHLEEDAGKSLHDRFPERTAIDFNRAGTPLLEIVTEPELATPPGARAFLVRLKQRLEYLRVSECEMEKGSLRVDANVSMRPAGTRGLGTRTELKNMNSFVAVERALRFEIERQTAILRAGGAVVHETLQWDARSAEARRLRTKEEMADYRYMPEPDLPPLLVGDRWLDDARAALPEMPGARAQRFEDVYGLSPYATAVLTATRALADYYEEVAAATDPEAAANWVMTDVLAWLNRARTGIDVFPIPPRRLAELIDMVREGAVPRASARHVFRRMAMSGRTAAAIVGTEGISLVHDDDALVAWVDEVIDAHPDEVRRYRAGETRVMNFLIGRIVARSRGQAEPRRAGELLRSRIAG